jgi:hypothetical protein
LADLFSGLKMEIPVVDDGLEPAGIEAALVATADLLGDYRVNGSSISGVRIERSAHPVPKGRVSADQRHYVVRDRIELSTFRFSGGRSYRLSYLTWLDTQ